MGNSGGKPSNQRAPAWLTKVWDVIKAIVMAPIALVTRVVERLIMGKEGVEAAERNGNNMEREQQARSDAEKESVYLTESITEQIAQRELNLKTRYNEEMAKPEAERDTSIVKEYNNAQARISDVYVYPIDIGRSDVSYGVRVTLGDGVPTAGEQKEFTLLVNKDNQLLNNVTCPTDVKSEIFRMLDCARASKFEEPEFIIIKDEEADKTPEEDKKPEEKEAEGKPETEEKPITEEESELELPENLEDEIYPERDGIEEDGVNIEDLTPDDFIIVEEDGVPVNNGDRDEKEEVVESAPEVKINEPKEACGKIAQMFLDSIAANGAECSIASEGFTRGLESLSKAEKALGGINIKGEISEDGSISLSGVGVNSTDTWTVTATRDDTGLMILTGSGDAKAVGQEYMRNVFVEAIAELSSAGAYRDIYAVDRVKDTPPVHSGDFARIITERALYDFEENKSRMYVYGGMMFTSEPKTYSIVSSCSAAEKGEDEGTRITLGKRPELVATTRSVLSAYTEGMMTHSGVETQNAVQCPPMIWAIDGDIYMQAYISGKCETFSHESMRNGVCTYRANDLEKNDNATERYAYVKSVAALSRTGVGYTKEQAEGMAKILSESEQGTMYCVAGNMCVSIEQTGRNKYSVVARKLDAGDGERTDSRRMMDGKNSVQKMIEDCAKELHIPVVEPERDNDIVNDGRDDTGDDDKYDIKNDDKEDIGDDGER